MIWNPAHLIPSAVLACAILATPPAAALDIGGKPVLPGATATDILILRNVQRREAFNADQSRLRQVDRGQTVRPNLPFVPVMKPRCRAVPAVNAVMPACR